jgi:uncharacterized protein YndB with AHSA1/START domain
MSDRDAKTRSFELELELDHPAETVWKALTDAEELVRWFPLEAKVEPGENGSVWLSWNDPWFFDTRIEVWEPGRELRLLENRSDDLGKAARIAMDFRLEGRGGSTVLRFVHDPPRSFAGVVPARDNGIIRYEYEGGVVVLVLSLWGDRQAEAEAFKTTWRPRLAELV